MSAFTVYFAVHVEADSAWQAVTDVERRLAEFEDHGEQCGIVFHSSHVTDEDGERVEPLDPACASDVTIYGAGSQ